MTPEQYVKYTTDNGVTVNPWDGKWWANIYPSQLVSGFGDTTFEALHDLVRLNSILPRLPQEEGDNGCHLEFSPKDDRQEEWARQRKERGFDDTELWSLNGTIIKFILPRLKAFLPMSRNDIRGYLEEVVDGFEEYLKPSLDTNDKKIDRAFFLFDKFFGSLWC